MKSLPVPKYRIQVQQRHIDESCEGNSSHCMVAEAIKDAIPDARFVSVDLQTIRFSDRSRGVRYEFLTPVTAQHAIVSFDQGIKPEPFTVILRRAHAVPCRIREGRKPKDAPKRPRVKPHVSGDSVSIEGGKLSPGVQRHIGARREFGIRGLSYAKQEK